MHTRPRRLATSGPEIDWVTVLECEPRVRLFASRLTNDPEEALEVVQDTVIRLSSALRRYRTGNLDGWLYRVTRNVFLDRCRRTYRSREVGLGPATDEPNNTSNPVEDSIDRADIRRVVRAALVRLPDHLRQPLVLRDIEGLSYQQIGEALEIPMGTVRSRIHRGRERLRVLLPAYVRPCA